MKTAVIYDKWLSGLGGGEVVACSLARTLKDNRYDVLFLSKDFVTTEVIREKLGIDLHGISFKQVSNEIELHSLATNHRSLVPDLFINISFMDYSYGIGKKNIYYVHFPSQIRSGLFNYVLLFFQFLKKILPATNDQRLTTNYFIEKINDRLRAGVYPDMRKRLDSYDIFICHSEYVKGWIKKLWSKDAVVLYPPVSLISTNDHRLTTKLNWIASVGRFFTLGHGKKQEIMIEAFKKLYDHRPTTNDSQLITNLQSPISDHQSPITNLQLHLIGGVGTEASSIRYLQELKEMATGFPIFFHLNVKREEVEEILLKSKFYWHAGGYGETNPINFEHFGISAVEALSAGCIPILFNGGGLVEIVSALGLDKNKFLFTTQEELVEKTRNLLSQKNIIEMDTICKTLSQTFSSEKFNLHLKQILPL